MKTLNLYGIEDIRYEESPQPVIEADQDVIIKVEAAGICGSDLSRYKKLGPYRPGTTFGHEFAGTVAEVGSGVSNVKIGDRVAACPTYACGKCLHCKSGYPSRCKELMVIGSKVPGAFAEYVKLPSPHVIPLPPEVESETAALIEPAAVVAHGFYRTQIRPGATVAVMGAGSIGLLAIQWARIFGAKTVIAIDIDTKKLDIAKEVGADHVIDASSAPAHEAISAYTDGAGVDLAVESAGSPITSAQVLALPKKGGEVVYLGIPYADINIERNYFEKIVRNELTIHGSWNALSAPFPGKEWFNTIHYMKTGQINGQKMISHHIPLSEGPAMFKKVTDRSIDAVKVLFHP
ncbi:galactitol-1-phosphate 5-dehydrogenase [Terribacillus sp. 179-K 1B1 HS]|uniref:galactitol-1-phosphate 5-dehydrogenase n=1 Tax=Terribacillus sp. 179-K 1B1 HS TaxID=3142388 RepID=UPI0039A28CE7